MYMTMSTGIKTGKVTTGDAVDWLHWVNLAPLYGCLYYRAGLRVLCSVHNIIWSFVCSIIMYCPAWHTLYVRTIAECTLQGSVCNCNKDIIIIIMSAGPVVSARRFVLVHQGVATGGDLVFRVCLRYCGVLSTQIKEWLGRNSSSSSGSGFLSNES